MNMYFLFGLTAVLLFLTAGCEVLAELLEDSDFLLSAAEQFALGG